MSIAKDIVSGAVCSICTSTFIDHNGNPIKHGAPAVCSDCWENLSAHEKKQHMKAEYKVTQEDFEDDEANDDGDDDENMNGSYDFIDEVGDLFIKYQGAEVKITAELVKEEVVYTIHTNTPIKVKIANNEDFWVEEPDLKTERAKELGFLIEEATS